MTMRTTASGAVYRVALKTAANGNSYIVVILRIGNGDAARWVSCLVFGQREIERVADLQPGEPLCVAGELDASVYTPSGGEPRVSLSIRVDGVLTARKPAKDKAGSAPRAAKPKPTGREIAGRSWAAPASMREPPL